MEIKIAVTGVNGFVGRHLTKELQNAGCKVIGIGREDACDFVDDYFVCNLAETWPEGVGEVDAVIHLAGLAAVGPSFDDPQTYINLNSAMVTHMAEFYLKQEKQPRLVIISSGSIYDPNQPLPIAEDGKIGLSSPYSVSKVLVENQAKYYRNRGLDCVIVRPFNHIGPGQLPGFIVPDLYGKISTADQGSTVSVGNLETKRDYTDVRDIVRAYTKVALAKSLDQTVYNVCSGRSYSGLDIFNFIKDATGRADVTYQVDPALVRPTDIPEIVGDSDRLQSELDWRPTITIEQTIKDFVAAN